LHYPKSRLHRHRTIPRPCNHLQTPTRKRRKVPLEDIPDLIQKWDQGARLQDLAEPYGGSHQALSKLLRKHLERMQKGG
jgi:hypothetical protein